MLITRVDITFLTDSLQDFLLFLAVLVRGRRERERQGEKRKAVGAIDLIDSLGWYEVAIYILSS